MIASIDVGETPPVPGEDRFSSLALVNTEHLRPGGPHDGLSDPAAASAWLEGRALIPPGVALDENQTTRLRDLRAASRDLFEARIDGVAPAAEALERANTVLARHPVARIIEWSDEGARRVVRTRRGTEVDLALGLLAEDAARLLTGAEAAKLALCAAPKCTRLMVRTHAARRWCSDRCGNRVRAARHSSAEGTAGA
ncbi:ABATE domain-containing protein [Actinomadura graeca]|uniref:ABATE domain-containing protein n=1 Tax=Actinomadura graeca TaxID=2750812 RepID=A0ABX8QX53_9ACTN|nr:CGNR zinc finger domain-containing protein [Actinomadura graeca]QXJ23386.1 ABATE domain-containing protein [Actinomadura graeca]